MTAGSAIFVPKSSSFPAIAATRLLQVSVLENDIFQLAAGIQLERFLFHTTVAPGSFMDDNNWRRNLEWDRVVAGTLRMDDNVMGL